MQYAGRKRVRVDVSELRYARSCGRIQWNGVHWAAIIRGIEFESMGRTLRPNQAPARKMEWAHRIVVGGSNFPKRLIGEGQLPDLPPVANGFLAGIGNIGVGRGGEARQQRCGLAIVHQQKLRSVGKSLTAAQFSEGFVGSGSSDDEVGARAL